MGAKPNRPVVFGCFPSYDKIFHGSPLQKDVRFAKEHGASTNVYALAGHLAK